MDELEKCEKMEMSARKKVGSYRTLETRAAKDIVSRIRVKRNVWKENARMKLFVVWRMLNQKCEKMRVRVRECKRAMECAEKIRVLEDERRKRRVADVRLLNRLRYVSMDGKERRGEERD